MGAATVLAVVVAVAVSGGDGGSGVRTPPSTRPTGPTAEADFAAVLPEDPPGAEPVDAFVLAGANRVALQALARPETVPDDQGRPLQPPADHRFVAAQLAFEEAAGSGPAAAGMALEVVDGGHRVDLTGLLTQDGLFYQDGWVAAVVPADDGGDDEAPMLEVTYRGHSERLDLARGERVDGSALLYEPLSVELGREVPEADVPVTIPVPTPHTTDVHVAGYSIARAELTAFEPNRGWAPEGQAWLVVTVEGLYEPSYVDLDAPDVGYYFRFAPWESFTVEADGAAVAPENAGPGDEGGMAVVFAVPGDLRSTTLHAAPRWILTVEDREIEVTGPAAEVSLEW